MGYAESGVSRPLGASEAAVREKLYTYRVLGLRVGAVNAAARRRSRSLRRPVMVVGRLEVVAAFGLKPKTKFDACAGSGRTTLQRTVPREMAYQG